MAWAQNPGDAAGKIVLPSPSSLSVYLRLAGCDLRAKPCLESIKSLCNGLGPASANPNESATHRFQ